MPNGHGMFFALFPVRGASCTRFLRDLRMIHLSDPPQAPSAAPSRRVDLTPHEVDIIGTARAILCRHISRNSVLSCWGSLLDYCALTVRGPVERLHVLYLDRGNRLIRDECHAMGTVDRVCIYPREIMRRALELDALALILAHNHPSGEPEPSCADLDLTRDVNLACAVLGLTLHDHIIVGATREVSLRQRGDLG